MLAPEEDVQQAEKEGVIIHNSRNFLRIISEKDRVTGVACEKIHSFSFDEKGELEVEAAPGSEHVLEADTVIMAVGVAPDFGFLDDGTDFEFTEKRTLKVDKLTMATACEGVFAAGDAVTGPSSVAEAIGTGREAAIGLHCFLAGMDKAGIRSITMNPEGALQIRLYGPEERGTGTQEVIGFDEVLNPDYYEKANRVPMEGLSTSDALKGSHEIYQGYNREEAIAEASRCFHCGHCAVCGTCADICPLDVIAMGEEGPEAVYPKECWHCGGCRINCPCGAVYYEFPLSMLI
jgi:heterodisulfide reductase subunit A-like polyferredoxin